MQVYAETLDPSETKEFAFDWSAQLSVGETVTAQVITFVTASGTTNPANSLVSPVSKVWLSGGTHGLRAIYTVRVTTSGGKTLEEAFAVDIVDSVLGPTAETDIDRLTREIAAVKAQRINLATGSAVIQVWRDGRRVEYKIGTVEELNALIRVLEGELSAAQAAAGVTVTSRRRGIGLQWA